MPGKHLNLIEKQKAKVLKATGATNFAIGQELGRSNHSIKACTSTPEAIVEISAFKVQLADLFENLAERLLNSITDVDIEKLNALQRTVSSGIAVDKMKLLRRESNNDGQPSNLEAFAEAMRLASKLRAQIEAQEVAASDAGQRQLRMAGESDEGESQPSDSPPEDVEKP